MPTRRRRLARNPQLERETLLVPIAAARRVIEEVSLWLGEPLHARYARRLAFMACRCYAHSESFREKIRRPGTKGRDLLYVFMRHWLTARLHDERFDLYVRLPKSYATGEPLPDVPPPPPVCLTTAPDAGYCELSPDARLLAPV